MILGQLFVLTSSRWPEIKVAEMPTNQKILCSTTLLTILAIPIITRNNCQKKHFCSVIYVFAQQARVFDPQKYFHPLSPHLLDSG
jgi:hypothetical protein